ncbi:Phosphoribosylaminoimidazole carboxylase ATPase subunit [Alkalibacterium sp. AK22]|uniref:ATP-grasp domain-containing protein n=1 Tax=Alkalibacterium sp. AK22 TaxID=1229520 RepID=UPI00044C6562|nr:ATP-grasp domain-containing protein [Alkalibacterium sp. AK22]EXJ22995.1 Phosphoribosylaminoimidazole carboxylase ATPase subunit [Alkalibacterium sp. AK22]
MTAWIKPGSTIGIIGGGSTARLLALAAKKMGYSVGVLDPQTNCLAKAVADWHITSDLSDKQGLIDLAMKSDLVIYASDAVNHNEIKRIRRTVPVPQGEELLSISQDRMLQKAFFDSLRLNVAPFATIVTVKDIEEAVKGIGFPCVLKANNMDERFKKHLVLHGEADFEKAIPLLKQGTCVLEAWIPSDKEVCLGLLKDVQGKVHTYPLSEMYYNEDELSQSIAPARIDKEMQAEVERIGNVVAANLDFVGMMAVEFFTTESGALYVNEIVAHPHRAYNYTFTFPGLSQHEAHIKAVTGWPIELKLNLEKSVVMRPLKRSQAEAVYAQVQVRPEWDYVFYENYGRKNTGEIGHVTIQTDDVQRTIRNVKEIFELRG